MSEDTPDSLIPYDEIVQEALRAVVGRVLGEIETGGGELPGNHHFYITFKTGAPGVSIPSHLRERFPDEMTIVLQHQYWDLAPGETFFTVTLKFGGQPKRVSVPYAAVTRFYDPSVQFLLQFETPAAPGGAAPAEPETAAAEPAEETDPEAKIVSLDQFRKK